MGEKYNRQCSECGEMVGGPAFEKIQENRRKLQTERDEAVAWIRVVGEEINSGGNRDATLKKIRMLRAAYDFADHTYHCGHKSGGKCNCGFDSVFAA